MQELKEMLATYSVLNLAISADFWQPLKNQRKAELTAVFRAFPQTVQVLYLSTHFVIFPVFAYFQFKTY